MPVLTMDAKGKIKLPEAIESLLCLNGGDEILADYHPEGTLIIRKVTCKARFEKWLDD
jgi:bifunctional DNA-binding transcriptional regulator/antitoxin component of YhaV-PrlF toxin-antitoxin module